MGSWVGHHVVGVVDVCQEDPLVDRDAEDHVVEDHDAEGHDEEGGVVGVHVAVGGNVEAVDNGKMEVDDDVGNEDAYDCPFQGMYGCRGSDYHV